MIRHTFEQLYGSRPVAFEIPGSPEAAAQALSRQVRSTWSILPGSGLIGRVSRDRVELQRRQMFIHNGLRPWFIGRFESDGSTTRLVGVYRIGRPVRVFMSLWFGFVIFWIAIATIVAVATAWQEPSTLIFPVWGLLVMFLGMGFVRFASAKGAADEAFIAALLREHLQAIQT